MHALKSCRTYLGVLQEGGLVVDAASWPVAKGVLAVDPGASHHLLFPGFMDAQVGCVDEAAQDQVGEVLTEIIKRHPAGGVRERRRGGDQQGGQEKSGGRSLKKENSELVQNIEN